MNNIRDHLKTVKQCTPITKEGFEMNDKDLDIMDNIKGTEVCEDAPIIWEHEKIYFEM